MPAAPGSWIVGAVYPKTAEPLHAARRGGTEQGAANFLRVYSGMEILRQHGATQPIFEFFDG